MLPLSPSNIVPDFEWQFEEQMMHEFPCDDLFARYNFQETDTSHNASNSSPQPQDFEYDGTQNSGDGNKKLQISMKKSCQHDYERERREKLNKLYSSLRELLPEKDKRKKLSIPCTIARVLKYIPELQKRVERLKCSKEDLLLRVPNDELESNCNKGMSNPVVSAICLSKKEIMIQICISNTSSMIPMSKVIRVLEREGLQLLNATTHTSHDNKTFYSLHLQVKKAMRMEKEIFCEKLMNSFSEKQSAAK
ncbi:transcription factor bHLH100 [Asparagus officinalis]|uniref:transcription factor bHLH100 n=1 Tax=Asparagus officinalis TaxID=4686 RepID=UPI00098E10F7|nr:transcription factor bHLH100 [Asparagus officinalis]